MKNLILLILALLNFSLSFSQDNTEVNFADYGKDLALGIEIGGGGLIGGIVRYKASQNFLLEGGLHYRPILVMDDYTETVNAITSIVLAGGINYYTSNKYKEHKQKLKFNGLFVKAGHGFSSLTENFIAAGWVSETFRLGRKNRSFSFELGPGLLISPWVDDFDNFNYSEGVEKQSFMLYWKVSWNFHQD